MKRIAIGVGAAARAGVSVSRTPTIVATDVPKVGIGCGIGGYYNRSARGSTGTGWSFPVEARRADLAAAGSETVHLAQWVHDVR